MLAKGRTELQLCTAFVEFPFVWFFLSYQYDDTATFSVLRPFIVRHLEEQRCNLGAATSVAICIGTGQNQRALQELNNFYRLFDTLLCVEHPRFIVQYRRATMHAYLDKYRDTLEKATEIASQEKNSK